LDLAGMLEDIRAAPKRSLILLHACAHNPTGVDPTHEEWKQIAAVCKEMDHLPWFDSAYQGFASGDLTKDSWAIRFFANAGFEMLVSQSFAKNFGLYGERIGTFSVIVDDKNNTEKVMSQLDTIIRTMYSNPPLHGARIVETVLSSPKLTQLWRDEMVDMSSRIINMRKIIFDELKRLNTPGNWTHITSQIGMFSYTGLTPKQCESMINKHHIYLLKNGRISMAGVTSKNAPYIAAAIDDVVRNC
jgi:aspartate/tyrosine/aromatic aminotransferase